MLEKLSHTITYLLPWWLQPLILCVFGVAVGVYVYRFLGLRGLIATIIAFSTVVFGRGAYKKGQSDGYSAAKSKIKTDGERLVAEAKRAREAVSRDIDAGRVYEDDGFKRPD